MIRERLAIALAGGESFGPVGEERICAAERILGVKFPVSYRTFLEVFGASVGPGYRLAGLPDAPPPKETPFWIDVVITNMRTRRIFGTEHIPSTLVGFADDGCDDTFYLDTNVRDSDGESPVVVLGPGRDCEIVAFSFVEFVEKAAAGHIL